MASGVLGMRPGSRAGFTRSGDVHRRSTDKYRLKVKIMPYKSKAQAGYFHANKAKLESQGVNVAEWDAASKDKKLPKRAKPKGKKR